jgi:TRAP-type mannitol/chloroaromatic compound transport system permease large subunit
MKVRKELWFGFSLMAIIVTAVALFTPWGNLTNGHLGLMMLAMIVVAIMLGFPTAFTLMGMGVFFAWLAYRSVDPHLAVTQVLDLMVQRAYGVMRNDVLIAVPLFVFMGYLVERAALIDRLFKSLHLALTRIPGSLAVATIITCAVFATATGIVGAVVTLMGLLALPAMLKAGYNVRVSAGAITAGGCLGIMIPPSILLIVYGATAGVSVVKLYAAAFLPGVMLAGLYVAYVIILAIFKPHLMPALPESERTVPLPAFAQALARHGQNAFVVLARSIAGNAGVTRGTVVGQLAISLVPALTIAALLAVMYQAATAPVIEASTAGLIEAGGSFAAPASEESAGLIGAPPTEEEKPALQEAQSPETTAAVPATAARQPATVDTPPASETDAGEAASATGVPQRLPAPNWFWVVCGVGIAALILIYVMWNWERLEIFKMLLTSFFPLSILILGVLGSIVMGFATPTEAAAVGALGGLVLAAIYRFVSHWREGGHDGRGRGAVTVDALKEIGSIFKESSFLTAKTTAMVCWLFVGSAIFSAAFALLGGQEIVEKWVLSLNMTPLQFMILAQFIIFILGCTQWTSHSSSCRSSFPCWTTSTSTLCSSGSSWRSTCRLPSSRRPWPWRRSTSRACRRRT